jgi:hypothetical protein
MAQILRPLLVVLAVLLLASPALAETAERVCDPWTFTMDGGFEGGELVAEVLCEVPGSDAMSGLALHCTEGGINLRAYLAGLEVEPDDVEVPITYQAGTNSYPLTARFEAADGAFASYLTGTTDEPNLITDLTRETVVTFAVEGIGAPTSVSLTGAPEAIAALQKACAELN